MSPPVRGSTVAYFDCNATTPTLPVAAQAAVEAMQTLYGNPSSSHLVGLQARTILEAARRSMASVLEVPADRLIFTSGATEAIQLAVFSVLETAKLQGGDGQDRVLYCATEHKAVPQALRHWVRALDLPLKVVSVPVDAQGQVVLEALERELPRALFLCTMVVNNETGVVQNLDRIAEARRRFGPNCRWLVDGVQGLGKVPLHLLERQIDYAPFSGHKLYAPKGIGLLYAREGAPLVPLIVGGGQERGLRSGTENLPGVAAFGAIAEELRKPSAQSAFQSQPVLRGYRQRLIDTLRAAFPRVEFNTPFEHAVPTTINFSVPGLSSRELLDLFDSAGVRLSAGSACSSASVEPSHVLDAMGVPQWRSVSALRLSFGPCTSGEEIERGCQAIREAAMALQSSCLLHTVGGFEPPAGLRDGVIQFRTGATNTWLVADPEARACIVIDPTDATAERLESYVSCQGLKVLAILDTHSHADHESTRPLLLKALADQLDPHAGKADALGWPAARRLVRLGPGVEAQALCLGECPDRGARVLARIPTPGHTSDSHAFLLGIEKDGELRPEEVQIAFVGDTILSGGLGRTNFTLSDPEALFHSLRMLSRVLGPKTLLCPAHDYDNSFATTLRTETRENMLLRHAIEGGESGLQAFVEEKCRVDERLAALEAEFQGIVCGVAGAQTLAQDSEMKMRVEQLRSERPGTYTLIDVREPQEHALFHRWEAFGLREPPRNVPLSRFVNFMAEVLRTGKPETRYVLLCRTGNRSLQAAKTLRRMGHASVWSLDGGIALL